MKKLPIMLASLILAACAQTPPQANSVASSQSPMSGCSCCQVMQHQDMMANRPANGSMQCGMSSGQCGCCAKMKDGQTQLSPAKQAMPSLAPSTKPLNNAPEHKVHHP